MRYMMLVYSTEQPDGHPPEEAAEVYAGHAAVIQDARQKGALIAAQPLAPTATATTVRVREGRMLLTDGPFAETKEQLAGYYILDCPNLDAAMEWAARIPTACKGGEGCIEIRPLGSAQSA